MGGGGSTDDASPDFEIIVHSRCNMKRILYYSMLRTVIVWLICPVASSAQAVTPVRLPDPQTDGGRPLMQVLKDRQTSRAFSSEPLPSQMLSNLLWAAFGVNRPETGYRTAPSAINMQEIDIYVSTADGLFLYEAVEHVLVPILDEDIRALTGTQAFVKEAPVTLVFVADYAKMGDRITQEKKIFYSTADVGFISQNVYLFCASEGLATGVRDFIDRPVLAEAMLLRPDQTIVLAQTIGFPGE